MEQPQPQPQLQPQQLPEQPLTTVAPEVSPTLVFPYHKIDHLWHVKVREGAHNHGPSLPGTHPSIRREEVNQKTQYIKALLDINMPPSQILKQLRHVDPATVIQVRDIYNLRHRLYQATIKKRRRQDSSDNQSLEEESTSGAAEGIEIGQGLIQSIATPVHDAPTTQAIPSPNFLMSSSMF
ncbi:hypothetical protein BJX70DRAFT_196137 [Aspergillus crustosus]